MTLRPGHHALPACLLLASALLATSLQAQPDFSGSWTAYRGDAPAAAAEPLKLKPEAQAAADAYRKLIDGTNYAPGNACVGYGMPETVLGSGGGYPMEIIQRPDHLLFINELHNEMRRIFLPQSAGDPSRFFPERNGYSTGHWEGDRLIVETTRLKTQVDTRYPHSHEAHIRETFYFDEPKTDGTKVLVVELEMEDPLWLEEPFRITRRWQALPDYYVQRYECTEPQWLDELERLYEEAGLEMVQN